MSNEKLEHFETLNKIDVSDKIEKKKSGSVELTYLSWAWAWGELKKKYPCAVYELQKFNGLPYVFDPLTGYMVYTKITIEKITHEMWLPVIDGANKAMKDTSYKYTTKFGEKTCETATMFDINKTIMRCLVKNIAMFGLGLYIYAGEDLPEGEEINEVNDKKSQTQENKKMSFNEFKTKLENAKIMDELLNIFKQSKAKVNGKDIVDFLNVELEKDPVQKAIQVSLLIDTKDLMKNELSKM